MAYTTKQKKLPRVSKASLKGLEPLQSLDLNKYYGKWYELFRLHPEGNRTSFEGSAARPYTDVTAEYTLLGPNKIEVKNSALAPVAERSHSKNGSVEPVQKSIKKVSIGMATPTDTPGVLEVGFVPWLPFIKGKYVVLDAGYASPNRRGGEYDYAVVGTPNKEMLWLLSRQPIADDALKEIFIQLGLKNGYSQETLARLYQTPHPVALSGGSL